MSSASLAAIAARYYRAGDTVAKPDHYYRVYSALMDPRRGDRIAILELGVERGSSLRIWQDYLPRATVVGLDPRPCPARILGQPRILYVRGLQQDPAALDQAATCVDHGFDIIIDDAAHVGIFAKASFLHLYPRHLKPGGAYVIEDLGAPMLHGWVEHEPYETKPDRDSLLPGYQHGLFGFPKQLIDQMQRGWFGDPVPCRIGRIEFEPNIVVVHKPA